MHLEAKYSFADNNSKATLSIIGMDVTFLSRYSN